MEWLRRIIRRILGRPEPDPDELIQQYIKDVQEQVRRPVRPVRGGIQSTDLGMRKLRRHRSGRLHDRRSGFDHDKRMVDIEDDQTRKRGKKKGTWHEDRKG